MNDSDYMEDARESLTKQAEMAGRKQVNTEASAGNKAVLDTLNKRDKRVMKRPSIKTSPKR